VNVFIVDDEKPAIQTIKALLTKYSNQFDISLIGSAQHSEKAVEDINRTKPDVIFLDIEMPILNGFDLINLINYDQYLVIMVTAYREYAADAFEANVFHYLVKPLSLVAFKKCLIKIDKRLKLDYHFIPNYELHSNSLNSKQIAIEKNSVFELLCPNKILLVFQKTGKTEIKMIDEQILSDNNDLQFWKSTLPKNCFVQVNHSTIINSKYIVHINYNDGGEIRLANNQEIIIDKVFRAKVFNRFKQSLIL
jgi:two-component system LytT family response regulator